MWNSRPTAAALLSMVLLAFTASANAADADSDGIPDDVENSYAFLNANDNGDAYLDHDGDGVDNLSEYVNGSSLIDGPSVAALNQDTHLVVQAGGITAVVPLGPVVNQFTSSPVTIQHAQSSVLSWKVDNADYVDITPSIGRGGATDNATITPSQSTTFTLTATGPRGTNTRTLSVIIDTDSDGLPDEIDSDDDNDGISDSVENNYGLNQYNASDAAGDLDGDGISNLVEAQHGWNLASGNLGGVTAGSTTTNGSFYPIMMDDITLILPMAPVLVNFSASPAVISHNGSSTLSWHINEADYVELSPNLGTTTGSGSIVVTPPVSTTYTLKAFGAGGDYVTTVTVTIDTDRDGIVDEVDDDDDGDRIPDAYELSHGLDPWNKSDAALDADNDGYSNLIEYLSGSEMDIALSVPYLRIEKFRSNKKLLASSSDPIELSWEVFGADSIEIKQRMADNTLLSLLDTSEPIGSTDQIIPNGDSVYVLHAKIINGSDVIMEQIAQLSVSVDVENYGSLTRKALVDMKRVVLESVTQDSQGDTYLGDNTGRFYKFASDQNGTLLWHQRNIGLVVNQSYVTDTAIYVATAGMTQEQGIVYALRPIDGGVIWQYPFGNPVMTAPVLNPEDGNLYVVGLNGQILALQASTGAYLWQAQLPEGQTVSSTAELYLQYFYMAKRLVIKTRESKAYSVDIRSASEVGANERVRFEMELSDAN